MIKTVVIEDEIHAREALKKILKLVNSNIHIIKETPYVSEAISFLKNNTVDLVFMDIELEDGTSFDILKELETIPFKIIFTTAYNQYAINAFKFSAIDYLLKPIDPLELQNAVQRATKRIDSTREYQELLKTLKHNIAEKEQKIVLKTTEQRYIILLKNIIRLEADGAYTLFITNNQKIIVSKNLRFYQNLLDNTFIRCHQSHLVNIKHVKGIDKSGQLRMSNNELINISTRKKTEIIQIIKEL